MHHIQRGKLLTSVLYTRFGHAMSLQHNVQDKDDLMYPVNLGPVQAISQWDASHLPWQVDESALQQLGKTKSLFFLTKWSCNKRLCSKRVFHTYQWFFGPWLLG